METSSTPIPRTPVRLALRGGLRLPSVEARQTFAQLLPLLGLFLLVAALTEPARAGGDEVPLLAAAHRLLEGRYAVIGTLDSTQFLWHGPGLPTLLAPFVALGIPLHALRVISPLLMFAAALMFYRLLRLRLSRRGALLGAYALGLYGPAYYGIGTVAKEPLALLLAVTALDSTARYMEFGRPRHGVIAGLAFGGLAMTRLEYGWVITVALAAGVIWWLVARLRGRSGPGRRLIPGRWLIVCAVAMLACMPWLGYTYAVSGHLFYWGNSGGISLYWMSSAGPDQLGEWHAYHSVIADPALAGYRAFFHQIGQLGPVGSDLELRHVALVQATAHPAKYALNLAANLGRMFFGFPFSFSLSAAVVAALILINGTLLAGLGFAARSLSRARSALPPEAIPFLMFAALGFGVHLIASAEPRMLVPIVPVAIWLIAQALHRRGIRHRQLRAATASASAG